MKKQEFKKMRRDLGTPRTSLNVQNIQIIGVPEGEEQEEEMENLFEQIMKENFPNLVKELDKQEAQSPEEVGSKRNTPRRHIISKTPKIKDKKRILKVAREKETVTYKGVPIRQSADFLKETLWGKKGLERSI